MNANMMNMGMNMGMNNQQLNSGVVQGQGFNNMMQNPPNQAPQPPQQPQQQMFNQNPAMFAAAAAAAATQQQRIINGNGHGSPVVNAMPQQHLGHQQLLAQQHQMQRPGILRASPQHMPQKGPANQNGQLGLNGQMNGQLANGQNITNGQIANGQNVQNIQSAPNTNQLNQNTNQLNQNIGQNIGQNLAHGVPGNGQFMMAPGAASQGHTQQMRHNSQSFPMQAPAMGKVNGMEGGAPRPASELAVPKIKKPMQAPTKAPMSAGGTASATNTPAMGPASAPAPGFQPGFKLGEAEQMQNDLNARLIKRNLGNLGVMRILDLIEQISSESVENLATLEYWQRVVQVYFLPNSVVRFTTAPTHAGPGDAKDKKEDVDDAPIYTLGSTPPNDAARQFEINPATAPRLLAANFQGGGMMRCTVALTGIKFQVLNNGCIFVISRLQTNNLYQDGLQATLNGNIKLLMTRDLRIDWIDCHCLHYEGSISFLGLERRWQSFKEATGGSDADDFLQGLYHSEALRNASSLGMCENAMRLLKVSDVMSHLRQLMGFSMVNNIGSPTRAIELFMSQQQAAQQQAQQQAQQHAQQLQALGLFKGLASPDTDDPKGLLKKRRMSATSGVNSPLTLEANKRRK